MKPNLQASRIVLLASLCVGTLLLGGCMWLFNTDPVAHFTATPGDGAAPLDVWFDATTSADPDVGDTLSFAWDFGDGSHAVGVTYSHQFAEAGTYRVKLSVDDGWGGVAEAYLDISVHERTYYAVVVGIADYYESPLEYTDDDAWDFAEELLKSPLLWDAENIVLLLNRDATTTNFMAALNAISEVATPNDLLIIFYSGHGSQWGDMAPFDETDGLDEALCFIDRDMIDDSLATLLNHVPVGELLVLVDACFSGGQIRGKSKGELSPQSVGAGLAEDLIQSVDGVGSKDLDDMMRSVVAITASADDESSIESASLQHGVFTYYLLEAMRGPADIYGNHDGLISAEECFAYLAPNVVSYTTSIGQIHHPQMLDYSSGELIFAK